MEVKIDTSCKTYLDCRGEFPIGHVKVLVNHYIDRAENLDLLMKVYKSRLKELEASNHEHKDLIIQELKNVFIEGRCDWSGSDGIKVEKVGTDMMLRHFPGDKLGYR